MSPEQFRNSMKNNYWVLFILLMLASIAGSGMTVMGKIALKEFPPFSYNLVRFSLASIFLLPLFLREKPNFTKISYQVFLHSLLATANVILFAFGVRYTTANIAGNLYSTVPIFVAIFAYFLLKEKFSKLKI